MAVGEIVEPKCTKAVRETLQTWREVDPVLTSVRQGIDLRGYAQMAVVLSEVHRNAQFQLPQHNEQLTPFVDSYAELIAHATRDHIPVISNDDQVQPLVTITADCTMPNGESRQVQLYTIFPGKFNNDLNAQALATVAEAGHIKLNFEPGNGQSIDDFSNGLVFNALKANRDFKIVSPELFGDVIRYVQAERGQEPTGQGNSGEVVVSAQPPAEKAAVR